MLMKLIAMGASGLMSLALGSAFQGGPGRDDPPPPPKAKAKKGGPGKAEVRKAYDLLRRLKADEAGSGKPEERLTDWTARATAIYQKALKAQSAGEEREAREYGTAAHDLARAVDHARNASRAERADPDLPAPPAEEGPEGERERAVRDLHHVHDRIADAEDDGGPGTDAKFYRDAAKDLYNAALLDAEAGRTDRAGELARSAEAITHVAEHLARANNDPPPPPKAKAKRKGDEPPKEKGKRPRPPGKEKQEDGPEPKVKRDRPAPKGELPPPIRD